MRHDSFMNSNGVSPAAAERFGSGLEAALTLDRPGIAELEEALALDPDFGLAHVLLARQCMIYGRAAEVEAWVEAASRCPDSGGARERGALDVTVAALRREPGALGRALAHIDEFPRDLFVLMQVVGPFGLQAFSGANDWRERNTALIDELAPHYSEGDWWFEAAIAFAHAETGRLASAEKHGKRAWDLRENGTTGHALAHVHIECGAMEEGAAFLDAWLHEFSATSDMRHHMVWHRALLELNVHGPDGLTALFDRELSASQNTPPLDVLSDNASLLWRLLLRDVSVPKSLWEQVATLTEEHFPQAGFAFADVHRGLVAAALAGSWRRETLAAFERANQTLALECCRGFSAFVDRDYATAATTLAPVLEDSLLIGGSNPQRGVIRETYTEALRRSRGAS